MKATVVNLRDWAISYRRLGKGPRRILFFHGFPGSSFQIELFRPFLESEGLEVICVDRPGYNGTETKWGDAFAEAREVISRVLEKEGWDRFEVVSVSGGTPFAVDFLSHHQDRVQRLTVVCGLGPLSGAEAALPWSSRLALRLLPWVPRRALERLARRVALAPPDRRPYLFEKLMPLSGHDRSLLGQASLKESIMQGFLEALQQKGLGPQRDARAFMTPWSFEALTRGSFRGERVSLWHGEDDFIIPPIMARHSHQVLPGSRLTLVPEEGHYSLPIRQMGRILKETRGEHGTI